MRFFTSLPRAAGVAALGTTTGLMLPRRLQPPAPAEPHKTATTPKGLGREPRCAEDPHLWLEEIEGEAALEWCKAQNSSAVGTIGDPHASESYRKILAIADSKDKIPHVGRIGGRTGDEDAPVYYNFWQDADNVRGVWRRTSLRSYRSAEPSWETVLSLDALNGVEARAEGEEWVWGGYDLLDEGGGRSLWDRALLFLSPGGTDATVVREFDLNSNEFVPGGFCTSTPAKCEVGFRRRDEVLIGTDFDGTGASLTDSGYPRVVKSWQRGTPLESAVTVFEVGKGDISASQYAYHDRGGAVHEFQLRSVSFYQSEQFYRKPDLQLSAADDPTPFRKVPIPDDTSLGTFGQEATLLLRSAWAPPKAPGGREYAAGSLLAAPLEQVMKGDWSAATVLFEPHADGSTSLQGYSATANYLVLETSRHVRAELGFWRHGPAGWSHEAAGGGGGGGGGGGVPVPVGESVGVRAIWPDDSDDVWLDRAGFLRPATLEMASAADACAHAQPIKALPAMFDASGHACTQHFATSADGTQVPYFLLAPKGMPLDSSHPTLLDGYGGFEISLTPAYSGGLGAAWLARGGVKAIANIRGGGEYGPRWHQAALREKRHKAYEDFEAVARDLVSRGVTSPQRLGCIGGSNGGLLTGNMITREGCALFGAVVCQVPLLDMRRYHKLLAGASWMEEYGNPDEPGVWESHLASISPYARLRGAPCLGTDGEGAGASWAGCPRVLFTTSTKDDRVHPGHARKMVKALHDEVPPALGGGADNVLYWENIEGGHGGAADNKQRAYMWALSYDFLWQSLAMRPSWAPGAEAAPKPPEEHA